MFWRLVGALVPVGAVGLLFGLPPLTNIWGSGLLLGLLALAGAAVAGTILEQTLNLYLVVRYVLVGLGTLVVVLVVPGGLLANLSMVTWHIVLSSLLLVLVGWFLGELLHLLAEQLHVVEKPNPVGVTPPTARAR